MNKHVIQAFIILIVILLGVSLVSESNSKNNVNSTIQNFEESVSQEAEINNGVMAEVNMVNEDSSNLISDVNSKVAGLIVGGLNSILQFGLRLIEKAFS